MSRVCIHLGAPGGPHDHAHAQYMSQGDLWPRRGSLVAQTAFSYQQQHLPAAAQFPISLPSPTLRAPRHPVDPKLHSYANPTHLVRPSRTMATTLARC